MSDKRGIASFQFISYKIDTVNLHIARNIGVLLSHPLLQPTEISFSLGIRDAGKYLLDDFVHYVGGINLNLEIFDKQKTSVAKGDFGISGLFRPINKISPEEEINMVQINIPAILLPYLRSAVSTILVQAGLGTVVLPLINIHEITMQHQVQIVDYTKDFLSETKPTV